MSSKNAIRNEISVDEQAYKHPDETELDKDRYKVVDETPEFQPTVEMEIQAKVDANHPDGIAQQADDRIYGVTLEQEERIRAREAELELISAQAELGTQGDRAQRTREIVTEQCQRLHRSDDAPSKDVSDPREELTRTELGAVNRQAARISEEKPWSHSRPIVAKALARRIVDGDDLQTAVLKTLEGMRRDPHTVTPIEDVPSQPGHEVKVEGEITQLWDPSDTSISQVGLIADETGKTKFTAWKKSQVRSVTEGERVQLWGAKVNWYQGRWSLALTYDSRVVFPDRGQWWKE